MSHSPVPAEHPESITVTLFGKRYAFSKKSTCEGSRGITVGYYSSEGLEGLSLREYRARRYPHSYVLELGGPWRCMDCGPVGMGGTLAEAEVALQASVEEFRKALEF